MKLIHSLIRSILLVTLLYQCTSIINQNSCVIPNGSNSNTTNAIPYHGIDYSWPQHHHAVHNTNSAFSEHRQNVYNHFLNGCYKTSSKEACDTYEKDRINMNIRQPQSVQNYTELGFKKIKAPTQIYNTLKEFWINNKEERSPEEWNYWDAAVNHWETPSYVIDVNNQTLKGGGDDLLDTIFQIEETISEWTNQTLVTTSCYGIRVYTNGAILTSHVDRLPLVSSAIINVDQDVDEPWPLEVIGHDGVVYNITMEPGDMILYESHSVIHGRPYPFKGRYYANIFVHFAPEEEGIPSYILEGSPEDEYRRREGVYTSEAIQEGDLETLIQFAQSEDTKSLLFSGGRDGYTPFHEAARLGRTKILKFLWSVGVDVGLEVDGESALDIAMRNLEGGHDAIKFLRFVLENPEFDKEYADFDSSDSEDGSSDDSSDD